MVANVVEALHQELVAPAASHSAAGADLSLVGEVVACAGVAGEYEEYKIAVAVVGEDFGVLEGVVEKAP